MKPLHASKTATIDPVLYTRVNIKTTLKTPSMKNVLNATESNELSQFMTSIIQVKLDPDIFFE